MYKRTLPITTTSFKMYLKIINSEDFLGFYKSDREQLISLPYLIIYIVIVLLIYQVMKQ